jgi:hypothetical protein
LFEGKQKEDVMQIVTSWEQRATERERSASQIRQGNLLVRQLERKLGKVPVRLEAAVMGLSSELMDDLGLAFLDFEGVDDLKVWIKGKGIGKLGE